MKSRLFLTADHDVVKTTVQGYNPWPTARKFLERFFKSMNILPASFQIDILKNVVA
jgi:hypothetical protein